MTKQYEQFKQWFKKQDTYQFFNPSLDCYYVPSPLVFEKFEKDMRLKERENKIKSKIFDAICNNCLEIADMDIDGFYNELKEEGLLK